MQFKHPLLFPPDRVVCVCVSVCFNRCSTESWNWIPIPVQIKGRKTTPGRWLCPPTNSSFLHFSSLGPLLDTEEQKKTALDQRSSTMLPLFLSCFLLLDLLQSLIIHSVQYNTVSSSVIFVQNKTQKLNYHHCHFAFAFKSKWGRQRYPFVSHVSHVVCPLLLQEFLLLLTKSLTHCHHPKNIFSELKCKPYINILHYHSAVDFSSCCILWFWS